MAQWKHAVGVRGNWTAKVTWDDGTEEKLPCVHQYFCRPDGKPGFKYFDSLDWEGGPQAALTHWRLKKHVDLLRIKGRAILTSDIVNPEAKRGGDAFFKRTGYVDVYDIEDVECDENGLRFKFVKRYRQKILGR